MLFTDRREAGRELAFALRKYRGEAGLVLALPRGGIECGMQVAAFFGIPMDLIFAAKISHPKYPEYAIGAVNEQGLAVLKDEAVVVDKNWIEEQVRKVTVEIRRRRGLYLLNQPSLAIAGKTVIIVDDGIATGATIHAAVLQVKSHKPARIIIGTPLIDSMVADEIRFIADELVSCYELDNLTSIGDHYLSFPQLEDEHVINLIKEVRYENIQ